MATAALLVAGSMLAACGDAGSDDGKKNLGNQDVDPLVVKADTDCTPDKFPKGSAMAKLAKSGKIAIGARYDQPGLGFKDATDKVPVGFDVDMAKLLIADLCIDPESSSVDWQKVTSDQREPFLQKGRVQLVAASYSITDDRRKLVGQTGPYLITGQQVLVPADSDVKSIDDLKGEEVCSAEGSTSLDNVSKAGAVGVPAETYGDCAEDVVNGTVPAMSTDGTILLGLAKQYDGELKVVGDEFSTENIGIGFSKKSPEMCQWINDVLTEASESGDWEQSFQANLGGEDVKTPDFPELDPCS